MRWRSEVHNWRGYCIVVCHPDLFNPAAKLAADGSTVIGFSVCAAVGNLVAFTIDVVSGVVALAHALVVVGL